LSQNKKHHPFIRSIGVVTMIPMVLAAGPLVGFLLGYWLDLKLGTDPWGKTMASLAGFVASIRQTIRLIKIAAKNSGP